MHMRVLLDFSQHPYSLLEHVEEGGDPLMHYRRCKVCLSGILCYQAGSTNIPFCIHLLPLLSISMWPGGREHEMGELNCSTLRSEEELSDNVAWHAKKFI